MDVGVVGLGRMGMGMGSRLSSRGHKVIGFDASAGKKDDAERHNIVWADSLISLCEMLSNPKVRDHYDSRRATCGQRH